MGGPAFAVSGAASPCAPAGTLPLNLYELTGALGTAKRLGSLRRDRQGRRIRLLKAVRTRPGPRPDIGPFDGLFSCGRPHMDGGPRFWGGVPTVKRQIADRLNVGPTVQRQGSRWRDCLLLNERPCFSYGRRSCLLRPLRAKGRVCFRRPANVRLKPLGTPKI